MDEGIKSLYKWCLDRGWTEEMAKLATARLEEKGVLYTDDLMRQAIAQSLHGKHCKYWITENEPVKDWDLVGWIGPEEIEA